MAAKRDKDTNLIGSDKEVSDTIAEKSADPPVDWGIFTLLNYNQEQIDLLESNIGHRLEDGL